MAATNMGRKTYICAAAQPEDLLETEFEALTWVEIKGIVTIGETGTTQNILTLDTMDTEVTQKGVGIANAGDPTIECGYLPNDPGQNILRTVAGDGKNYAFKFELKDALTTGGTNTIEYNRGIVTGPIIPNGAVEDFVMNNFPIGMNQKNIIVPAT